MAHRLQEDEKDSCFNPSLDPVPLITLNLDPGDI